MSDTMNELTSLLHEGGYTLVVRQGATTRTFTRRGVADLLDLIDHDPAFLDGASVADKVVGKGAAALMVKGGVSRLHTDVVSRPALELLQSAGIDTAYDRLVPHIVNRAGTDWCPVERLCHGLESVDAMTDAIRTFVNNMKQQ